MSRDGGEAEQLSTASLMKMLHGLHRSGRGDGWHVTVLFVVTLTVVLFLLCNDGFSGNIRSSGVLLRFQMLWHLIVA
jgi:hypothetical protein